MNSSLASPCSFCHLVSRRILAEDELIVAYKDGFPVSQGHKVIIPRRHVAPLFDASKVEQPALFKALEHPKDILDKCDQPDGDNIGINHGRLFGASMLCIKQSAAIEAAGEYQIR